VPHGGRQTGLGSRVILGPQDEVERCPGPRKGRRSSAALCVGAKLASAQMSSRVEIRPGPCRVQFSGTDLWLWIESRRKHELYGLVPAVYLDSVLGVVKDDLEVARIAFRGSSIFGLTRTFS